MVIGNQWTRFAVFEKNSGAKCDQCKTDLVQNAGAFEVSCTIENDIFLVCSPECQKKHLTDFFKRQAAQV